jgi:hypothetical protein
LTALSMMLPPLAPLSAAGAVAPWRAMVRVAAITRAPLRRRCRRWHVPHARAVVVAGCCSSHPWRVRELRGPRRLFTDACTGGVRVRACATFAR